MDVTGSSSRELLDGIEIPGSAKARPDDGPHQPWTSIARAYSWDYVLLLVLAVVTAICEGVAPFSKVLGYVVCSAPNRLQATSAGETDDYFPRLAGCILQE